MLILILMLTCFSGTAGGGAHGKAAGIAHVIMTGVGFISIECQVFILMSTRGGEDSTETMTGTDTGGTINGFLTSDFDRTGRAGTIMDIGEGKEPGASRAINLELNNRDSNSEIKGRGNIIRGQRSSGISNKDKSSKDNRDSSNPKSGILNLGASNARENRNTNVLKEDLKGGKENIDSKPRRHSHRPIRQCAGVK